MSNERKEHLMTNLSNGVRQLVESNRWQEWLAVQSRFHKYSSNNALLILSQFPNATQVAGFHAWRGLGRNVRKGEKAIWILAPMTRKVRDDDALATAESNKVLFGFKAAAVFDISQTHGEELPELCIRIVGDDPNDAYSDLVHVADSLGYEVEDAEFDGGLNGICDFELGCIRVEANLSPAQRVKTLSHEVAHAILHEGFTSRELAELEAESVAFCVCSALGIDSSVYSFGYLAVWAGDPDKAINHIKTAAGRIQQATDFILSKLEAASGAARPGDVAA